MSISKSFNKQTNTWYVYETDFVWDEAKQKKVQKRRCVGKIDPETGNVIPTKKGSLDASLLANANQNVLDELLFCISDMEHSLSAMQTELKQVKERVLKLSSGT